MLRHIRLWGCLLGLICAGSIAHAQPAGSEPPAGAREADIDALVQRTMSTFNVPGIAVGVVKDGKLVFARGYGVRELGKPERVDPDTIFAIGSNSKAFTAAALAMLVDEGKIRWDDKVIDYLPAFRLQDPYVTREFTIRDLLTHRSGLGLGAGDLMMFPETDFKREEIIQGLRHLRPVSSFRSEYAYDNLLYIVAGEIIPAVTGKSWEDFVETRILRRLDMAPCAVTMERLKADNISGFHAPADGKVVAIKPDSLAVAAAAGSIQCNVRNMAKWVAVQLAGGKLANGETLFSAEQHRQMWSPQTILPVSPMAKQMNRTHFRAYGLGWGLEDFDGYLRVNHSGGVMGTVTYVNMLPELNLGVVVLTNQQSGEAMNAIALHLLKAYSGGRQQDWVTLLKSAADKEEAEFRALEARAAKATKASAAPPPLPLQAYVGTYRDPWRGDATIRQEKNGLVLSFSRTKKMEGVLSHNGRGIFVVRWNDRSLAADAYVRFSTDFNGEVNGMTMQAVSPRTDFSFDFHDLDFKKVKPLPAGQTSAAH